MQSIDEAEGDEERTRLRREFEEETREYSNYQVEEKENLNKRNIEKERQTLKNEYHKKSRRLEQNHDKNVRLLEKECRRDAFNLEKNRLDIEPDACKKKLCWRKSLGGTQDLSRMTTMPASGNCGENR